MQYQFIFWKVKQEIFHTGGRFLRRQRLHFRVTGSFTISGASLLIYALFCPAPRIFTSAPPCPAEFCPRPAPPLPAEIWAAPIIPGQKHLPQEGKYLIFVRRTIPDNCQNFSDICKKYPSLGRTISDICSFLHTDRTFKFRIFHPLNNP